MTIHRRGTMLHLDVRCGWGCKKSTLTVLHKFRRDSQTFDNCIKIYRKHLLGWSWRIGPRSDHQLLVLSETLKIVKNCILTPFYLNLILNVLLIIMLEKQVNENVHLGRVKIQPVHVLDYNRLYTDVLADVLSM